MFPYHSLDDFLAELEELGELKRIRAEIDAKYDLSGMSKVLGDHGGPAVICENMKANLDIPMLTWAFGSWKRTCMALGTETRDEAIAKVLHAVENESEWLDPVMVESGPCKEIIIGEDEIDLWKQLPAIWGGELEHNAYITQGLTISKDPETGIRNAGCYRHAFLDVRPETNEPYPEELQKRHFASFVAPGANHCGEHLGKMNGKPLEVAIAVGLDPTVMMTGGAGIRYGADELALAGCLRGKPVELVKCETVDLEVPASAHFVIEGELYDPFIDPAEFGPFGEFFGYTLRASFGGAKCRVKCITRRKEALWPMVVETHQPPNYEHAYWINVMETASLYAIRKWVNHIKKIVIPVPPGNMHNSLVIVQIGHKPYAHFAKQVMRAVWSMKPGMWAKCILVVGPEVDPDNMGEIMVALQNNVQPAEDITIYKDMPAIHGWDPSVCGLPNPMPLQMLETGQSQVGIDATIKVPERIDGFSDPLPRRTTASKELEQRVYNKLKDELGLP